MRVGYCYAKAVVFDRLLLSFTMRVGVFVLCCLAFCQSSWVLILPVAEYDSIRALHLVNFIDCILARSGKCAMHLL
jgi:hypothetical protein